MSLLATGIRGGKGGGNPTPTPSEYPVTFTLATIPEKPPARTVQTATVTPANFAATLAGLSSAGGVTLYCDGGDYGDDFDITRQFDAPVWFVVADESDPPYWNSPYTTNSYFWFTGARNIVFDGWEFRAQAIALPAGYNEKIVQFFSDSRDCRLTRCTFEGSLEPTLQLGVGMAVASYGCTRIQIDRCIFKNLAYGIIWSCDELVRCSDCYDGFNDFTLPVFKGIDSHNFNGIDVCVSEWNLDVDRRPEDLPGGLHADSNQGFVNGFAGTGSVDPAKRVKDCRTSNLLIRKGFAVFTADSYYQPSGDPFFGQTVLLGDAETEPEWFEDIVIEDCEFYFIGFHAITVAYGDRVLIRRNQCYSSNRAAYSALETWISCWGGGFTVEDNVVDQVIDQGTTSLVQSGNTVGAAKSDAQGLAARDVWLAARALLF